tara:strand:- start:183 stop:800 length:618 start_codon:yes stop_codon:yes gene_type:complete
MQLQAKELHNVLKFKCKQCGKCCDTTIIHLYPFDIKNICEAKSLTTKQFHQQHSIFKLDEDKIPRCILKNRPKCPFKDNGCTIYDKRPIRCRLYPLGRVYQDNEIIHVISEKISPGFNTGHKQTIAEWLEQQQITKFDPLTKKWNDFIISLKDQEKSKFFPIIFRKVFYDFDDPMIKEYRKEENSLEEFMDNLYRIFEMLIKKIN